MEIKQWDKLSDMDSLDLIQAGAFICEYTGVVLTREQTQNLTRNAGFEY